MFPHLGNNGPLINVWSANEVSHLVQAHDTNANKCVYHSMYKPHHHFLDPKRLCLCPARRTVPVCSDPSSSAIVESVKSFPSTLLADLLSVAKSLSPAAFLFLQNAPFVETLISLLLNLARDEPCLTVLIISELIAHLILILFNPILLLKNIVQN